ncbi:MAG TPA: AAA family ATPase [Gemmatimonadales bacterium]|jgi:DNA-binding SARP family transcriptional activator|nr:AAA family ATPase [Gemmatimonadales bacterium]
MISCQALGPLHVTVNGKRAPKQLMWRRNIALLLYLARAPARRCTRDHAIGLFWAEKSDAAARQSLREATSTLRRYLGDELRTEGDQLELAAGAVELDTEQFDARVAAHDWGGATALVRGEFAQGFKVPKTSAFEDWLLVERGHWHRRTMDALIAHAEERLDAGDLLGVDKPVTLALRIDPLSERALRAVLYRHAIAGDRAGALAAYKKFAARVGKERGTPLEPETVALAERLRNARLWRLPVRATATDAGVEWRRAPLIAREAELVKLLGCWRDARTGRAALVVIEAEAGFGKTRLAEEVVARAVFDGGVALGTRAVAADREQPLAALASVAGEWAERFPTVRTAAAPAPNLVTALTEILRVATKEHPVLLVCDDAQWLDGESFAALGALLRNLARAPLLLVIAATGEPKPPALAELRSRIGRDVRGVAVRLQPFTVSEIHALVRWALPAYKPAQAERASRRILADSGGNPLLAVEICHAVAQGLDLGLTDGAWPRPLTTLDQTMPGDLPDTIVRAIRVAFHCLTANARAALAAAAVLGGERVTAKRLGAASRLKGAALDAALDELEWRRWLVAERRGYTFVARIVRDVVRRDMVTPGQAQRILDGRE